MPREKSLESYDKDILKLKGQLARAKERYDVLAERLVQLQEKKQQQEAKKVMAAFRKSKRSMQELMIFLEG